MPMFDWRQLRRWNLSEAALPKGSIVINREFTLWDFKYHLLGIVAVGVLQWFLIAGLIAQRRRRATADESLKERLRYERLVSQISARFLNVTPDEIDREIEGALKEIADFFRVTHSVLIRAWREEHRAGITHAAHAEDVPPTPIGENLYPALPWISRMCEQGQIIRAATLDELPAEAAVDKEFYRNLGVRSFLIVPVILEGSPAYAISISSRREERAWPEDYIPRVTLLGEILVSTLERKRAESSAMQKTEELDRFFNVTPDLLCIANAEGYFVRLNAAAETILACTREELMATRIIDFIHPEDLERSREAGSTLASQSPLFSFENRFRCKEGAYRWLQWSAAPAGNLIYAAARDVTERKDSEESLRKAEEKYRNIFEGALEGIFEASGEPKSLSTNPAGEAQNITINPALAKLLGYDSVDEIRSSIIDAANQVWVNPNDREALLQLLRERDVARGFECQLWHKDRTRIWVSISGRRVCGPDGKTLSYSGFIEDITERKRAEEAMVRHSKHIEFLSMTAIGLVELSARDDIYAFIGERLRQLIQEAVYVSVNSIDRETREIQIRALLADDQHLEAAARILGTGLTRMSFPLGREAWDGLNSGRLVRAPGGIYELLFGTIPKAACEELERLAGIGDIFTIGIPEKGELYGSATILMRKGSQLYNGEVVETFMHQAGMALQRLLAENELKESEERFRTLVEESPVAIGISRDGVILYANRKCLEMFGFQSLEELRGRPFLDRWAPQFRERLAKIKERPIHVGFEGKGLRKDGSEFFLRVESNFIQLADGRARVAFLTDITERKRAEEALRESEKEAQRIAREALAMAEIGRIISSTLTVEEVYEPFAAVVKKIIPFDRIVINMIDSEKGTVRNVYIAGGEIDDREMEKVYPLEGSGNAEMLRTKSTFLLQTEDFKDYEDRFPMLLSTFQAGFRSILNVPLFSEGRGHRGAPFQVF